MTWAGYLTSGTKEISCTAGDRASHVATVTLVGARRGALVEPVSAIIEAEMLRRG